MITQKKYYSTSWDSFDILLINLVHKICQNKLLKDRVKQLKLITHLSLLLFIT